MRRERASGTLPGWRDNVGAPVSLDVAAPASAVAAPVREIALLSWNVWVGRGRLREIVSRLRGGAYEGVGVVGDEPLVILVQEAFRSDETIPQRSNGSAPRDRPGDYRPEEDVAEVAGELGLSLRYVPSMRNGVHRSDRGNAVLSSLPLSEAAAFELPFVAQRRVSVETTVDLGGAERLRVCSAHLAPWGQVGRDWLGVAGRGLQSRALVEALDSGDPDVPLILGADLNTTRGRGEAAYRVLAEAGFTAGVPHRNPTWRHTYHMMPRLVIDHLLVRDPAHRVAAAEVHRLSENPRDAGPFVFGSDHHPLLARIELAAPAGASDPARPELA